MNKKDAIRNLILSLIGIAGVFIGGYWGGLITGASLTLILLITVGQMAFRKSIKKINNTIRNNQQP